MAEIAAGREAVVGPPRGRSRRRDRPPPASSGRDTRCRRRDIEGGLRSELLRPLAVQVRRPSDRRPTTTSTSVNGRIQEEPLPQRLAPCADGRRGASSSPNNKQRGEEKRRDDRPHEVRGEYCAETMRKRLLLHEIRPLDRGRRRRSSLLARAPPAASGDASTPNRSRRRLL